MAFAPFVLAQQRQEIVEGKIVDIITHYNPIHDIAVYNYKVLVKGDTLIALSDSLLSGKAIGDKLKVSVYTAVVKERKAVDIDKLKNAPPGVATLLKKSEKRLKNGGRVGKEIVSKVEVVKQ